MLRRTLPSEDCGAGVERAPGDAEASPGGAQLPLRGETASDGGIGTSWRQTLHSQEPDAVRERLDQAVNGLHKRFPEFSSQDLSWPWQRRAFAAIAIGAVALILAWPRTAVSILLIVLAIPFTCVVALRAVALWHGLSRAVDPNDKSEPPRADDGILPTYTVLVPLFREAAVLPDLIEALSGIDYPPSKLEILLIVEVVDQETRAALGGVELTPSMRVVIVPDGAPRTKPRALNYALQESHGDIVVVYDAEDLPEPGQLRLAAARLASSDKLACVQARLNVYNVDATWLARQFTIEYTALFDCLLPTLERLRFPVPLGGTSNHFPRTVLEGVGGWDSHNVTEDADLGIRLARKGWRVAVLDSTTWEEAPAEFPVWIRQRTRWLKGWMQTYLVHMRDPPRLLAELGLQGFLGLQILMGGMLLSALVHPWFYVLTIVGAVTGTLPAMSGDLGGDLLWWIGLFNLIAGYATGVALGCVAVARRGQRALLRQTLLMPVYWLLISAAAYRALFQLFREPFVWEKTDHSARKVRLDQVTGEASF